MPSLLRLPIAPTTDKVALANELTRMHWIGPGGNLPVGMTPAERLDAERIITWATSP